jgi:hypothetical protein
MIWISVERISPFEERPEQLQQHYITETLSHHAHLGDLISSRNHGDEVKDVYLSEDDQSWTFDTITIATTAGIPIPYNVSCFALMGATIKRLGRIITMILQNNCDDGDLDLSSEGGLNIRRQDALNFADALRQVSYWDERGAKQTTREEEGPRVQRWVRVRQAAGESRVRMSLRDE